MAYIIDLALAAWAFIATLGDIALSIAALILTLGILVTFHEYGHFWVARRCGVKVLRFSVGFGKPLKSWYGKDGVEYALAPIPLGGYVKMLGHDDFIMGKGTGHLPSELRHRSFADKPLSQRMAIVAAGPMANFLLAAVIFWMILMIYGTRGAAPMVDAVAAGSPAAVAGLRAGDEIIAVDGEPTEIWREAMMGMMDRIGESGELELTVAPGSTLSIPIDAWMGDIAEPNPLQELGIHPARVPQEEWRVIRYGPLAAVGPALQETWDTTVFTVDAVGKLITGMISPKNINGPITIAEFAGDTVSYGFVEDLEPFLTFLALLSVTLGVLNLLPIPVLDGGHLLFFAIEGVLRRPVPVRVQAWSLNLGLLLLAGVMGLAFYNDINRLL